MRSRHHEDSLPENAGLREAPSVLPKDTPAQNRRPSRPDGVLGRDDELDRSSSLTGLDPV